MCLDGSLRHNMLATPPKEKKVEIRTGISLIAVQIQLIRAGCRLNMLVGLDRIYPRRQSASLVGIWPTPIRFQDPPQPKNPWRRLNVYEGHLRAHKEGPFRMRYLEQLLHRFSQLLRLLDLFLLVLLLQYTIETRHDMPIDLNDYQL
jgi:hypothetical protein